MKTWKNIKDKSVRNLHAQTAISVKKLNQNCKDNNTYFLVAYDEMIIKPKLSDFPGKRQQPVVAFFVPESFNEYKRPGNLPINYGKKLLKK